MMKKNILQISSYLDELITNPICELNYNKDYELLIAVMLSANTTDKGVNKVTSVLFKKYKSLEDLNNSNVEYIKIIISTILVLEKLIIINKFKCGNQIRIC